MCTGIAPDCYLQIAHVYGELLPKMLQHAPSNLLLAASNLKGSLEQYYCSCFYGTLIFKLLIATFRFLMCTGNCSQDCAKQFIACSKQSEGSNPDQIAPSNLLLGAFILLGVRDILFYALLLLAVLEILLLSIFIACRLAKMLSFIPRALILFGVQEILLFSIFIVCRLGNIAIEHFYCLPSWKYCYCVFLLLAVQ